MLHLVGVASGLALLLGGSFVAYRPWKVARTPPRYSQELAETQLRPHQLTSLHLWSGVELERALLAIQQEQQSRAAAVRTAADPASSFLVGAPSAAPKPTARFRYVHKHTYASSDPKAAAYFMAKYFGGWCNHEPGHGIQHTHCNDTRPKPITWNVYYNPTVEQPHGFSIHFVDNPRKLPHAPMNQSSLALWLEKWRGNFSATGRFDAFMDNHLGLLFDNLDPLVEQWERDGVPFVCRTWCCGPGMPQYPDHCPKDRDEPHEQTDFCEQGCYVEVPHGIIVEALCGLEGYNASRKCLSRADSHLKMFDLCTDS
mmetsp:Transcript_300/g.562  ORF Transcript_300/g.562 Transcript_300/m.562 type:complete len:313 (+) Transcript_300:74-1012(+)